MTPQLQQAIKLLQLSNLELTSYVEQELERNPLLERDDRDEQDSDGEESAAERDAQPVERAEPPDHLDLSDTGERSREEPLDTDYDNVYDEAPADVGRTGPMADWGSGGGGGRSDSADDGSWLEQRHSERPTLRDHLLDQLRMDLRDPVDHAIGLHLIEMLDDSGYVAGDLEELAAQLGCPLERVEATLARLQRFDPPGIFARSLRECLALQLADRNRLDPAMETLLDNLTLLARREFAALQRLCRVDSEDFAEMVAEIRALNPKPAQVYDFEIAEPIVPDILMRANPAGGWIIELNSDTLPRVLVNSSYYMHVAPQLRDKRERDYMAEQLQSANWLVKSLHQRANTILKVAGEIVRRQDAFFRRGVQHLRPLTLRDIAETISMHESTVSRVTSNKYIATPRGIYELKYFFSAALGGADGESHSAEAVRYRIRALIDAEPADAILSDDKIVGILRADGIDIARRTVAKYREAMHIPSSVERRRTRTFGA